MHKIAVRSRPSQRRQPARTPLSATHASRPAAAGDSSDIHELIAPFVAQGLLLPRSVEDIEANIASYVVVVNPQGRVEACAALTEYSPSLAEVSSVAVSRTAQGRGLGRMAVSSVEAMARRRGIRELFALSLAGPFFESLAYAPAPLEEFPEKLARYEALAAQGVSITPKGCFRKTLS